MFAHQLSVPRITFPIILYNFFRIQTLAVISLHVLIILIETINDYIQRRMHLANKK